MGKDCEKGQELIDDFGFWIAEFGLWIEKDFGLRILPALIPADEDFRFEILS